jgi:hypothetical protein
MNSTQLEIEGTERWSGESCPRPTKNDLQSEISDEVFNYLQNRYPDISREESDFVTDLVLWGERGYEIAKSLEQEMGWYDLSSYDVDNLDAISWIPRRVVGKATKQWWSFRPDSFKNRVSIGDLVVVSSRGSEYVGEVIKIDECGDATVMIEELDHVREGVGTHGIVKAVEELKKVRDYSPTTILCTHCNAKPGEPCSTRSGRIREQVHLRRSKNFYRRNNRKLIVKALRDNGDIKEGEYCYACKYRMDPEKGTFLARLRDRHNPERNFYWHEVKVVGWMHETRAC